MSTDARMRYLSAHARDLQRCKLSLRRRLGAQASRLHCKFVMALELNRRDRGRKQADLMIMKGTPAMNISEIEKVEIVFKDGVATTQEKPIQSVQGLVGIR